MSYGDYVEQLTALTLALSHRERGRRGMADERTKPPYNKELARTGVYIVALCH
jgi:hypothetical protein